MCAYRGLSAGTGEEAMGQRSQCACSSEGACVSVWSLVNVELVSRIGALGTRCVSGRETTGGFGYWGDQEVQINCWRGRGVWGPAETHLGMCVSVQKACVGSEGAGSYWTDCMSMGNHCRGLQCA